MTVHKSKGLEYDTILFVGLDDRQFHVLQDTRIAKGVSDLYDLLAAAGVPEKEF